MQTVVNPLISLYIKNCPDLTFNEYDGLPELLPISSFADDADFLNVIATQCGIQPRDIIIWTKEDVITITDESMFINPLQSYLLVNYCTSNKIDIFGLIKSGYAHDIS